MNTILDRTTPPPTHAAGHISLVPQQIEHLENGIDLHIVKAGDQPLSRLSLYRCGGAVELGNPAAVSVAATTMREETAQYNAETLADIVDFNGARLSSRASGHHTGVDLVSLNSRLPYLLPVVGSILTEPSFTEQHTGVVARKASAMCAVQMANVAYRAVTRLRELLMGQGNPSAVQISPADYEAVTAQEARQVFERMRQGKIHAFLGGSMPQSTVDEVRSFLESLPTANQCYLDIVPYTPDTETTRCHIDMPDTVQWAVALGTPTIGREHPDYIALRLAIMALGGYFGSRLMQNIREEKGLTYGINASLMGSPEGAFMEILAQCDGANVDTVIAETRAEIYRLAQCPPEGDELHRLKQHAWSILASSVDSAMGILDHYVTQLVVGTPQGYFESQLQQIETLTPLRIAEVAEKYLNPESLTVVTAGWRK